MAAEIWNSQSYPPSRERMNACMLGLSSLSLLSHNSGSMVRHHQTSRVAMAIGLHLHWWLPRISLGILTLPHSTRPQLLSTVPSVLRLLLQFKLYFVTGLSWPLTLLSYKTPCKVSHITKVSLWVQSATLVYSGPTASACWPWGKTSQKILPQWY